MLMKCFIFIIKLLRKIVSFDICQFFEILKKLWHLLNIYKVHYCVMLNLNVVLIILVILTHFF